MAVGDKKNILIVDDDAHLLDLLQQTLSALGYDTKAASGGAEALDILSEHTFDLMVTDIKMPNVDGISLLRKVRRHYPDMPVLFITGVASPEIIAAADPDGFLAKPFRISHIEELIEATLKRHRETANGRPPPRHILVVDTDDEYREVISEALQVGDFIPFAVANEHDAIRELGNGRFDAIVADLSAAAENPAAFLERIQIAYPNLPIVLVDQPSDIQSLTSADIAGSLKKPFAMSEMLTLLNGLVPTNG